MLSQLTEKQLELYNSFLEFNENVVMPYASEWDINECMPREVINECAKNGYLGATIPKEYGGMEWDTISFGLLCEAIGRDSASLAGLFNVHNMVSQTLMKWGTEEQKKRLLPAMAKGELLGALALTEPEAGSDISCIQTEYVRKDNKLILNGTKRWITFGGIADIIIVFGKLEGKSIACIVEKKNPNLRVTPIKNMLSFKSAHLAILEFTDCEIDEKNIIGREGFAFSHLAPYALEYGRISVAWGGLGILRGCIEVCGKHSLQRKAFGSNLIEHGDISRLLTEIGVDYEAAMHLCYNASKLKDEHNSSATEKIMIAKYFVSRAATKHSANAVQIMGAIGCNDSFLPSRLYRDSKAMEIIEGSNQIHQMLLAKKFARMVRSSIKVNKSK